MKAITTTYHGPTDTRGSRISATDSDGNRVSVPYDYSGNDTAHDAAALALCRKLGWSGRLMAGHTKRGRVYVWLTAEPTDVLVVDKP